MIETLPQELHFTLHRSARKTVTLRFLPDLSLEVRAPLFFPLEKIVAFVASKEAWVRKIRAQWKPRASREVPAGSWGPGQKLWFQGRELTLRWEAGRRNAWEIRGSDLVFQSARSWSETTWQTRVRKWIEDQAQETFTRAYQEAWTRVRPLVNRPCPELKIRRMKSRWGVCTRSGEKITLALELIHLDPRALELVVYHEFCHLKHLGHDQKFYGFLAKFLPDHRQRKELLRRV